LHGGDLERREEGADRRRQVSLPWLQRAGLEEEGEQQRAEQAAGGARRQREAARPAVDERSRDRARQQQRQRAGERRQRELRRQPGGLEHPDADGEADERRAEHRGELAAEQQGEATLTARWIDGR